MICLSAVLQDPTCCCEYILRHFIQACMHNEQAH